MKQRQYGETTSHAFSDENAKGQGCNSIGILHLKLPWSFSSHQRQYATPSINIATYILNIAGKCYTCLIHGFDKSKVSFPAEFNLNGGNLLSYWPTVVNKDVVVDWQERRRDAIAQTNRHNVTTHRLTDTT